MPSSEKDDEKMLMLGITDADIASSLEADHQRSKGTAIANTDAISTTRKTTIIATSTDQRNTPAGISTSEDDLGNIDSQQQHQQQQQQQQARPHASANNEVRIESSQSGASIPGAFRVMYPATNEVVSNDEDIIMELISQQQERNQGQEPSRRGSNHSDTTAGIRSGVTTVRNRGARSTSASVTSRRSTGAIEMRAFSEISGAASVASNNLSVVTPSRVDIITDVPSVASVATRYIIGADGMQVAEPVDEDEERAEIMDRARRMIEEYEHRAAETEAVRIAKNRRCLRILSVVLTGVALVAAVVFTIIFLPGPNDDNGKDNKEWTPLESDNMLAMYSNERFGYSVAASSDGAVVCVGAPGLSEKVKNGGGARIYEYKAITTEDADDENMPVWEYQQLGQTLQGKGESDRFGSSVALSANGRRAAVGALNGTSQVENGTESSVYPAVGGSGYVQIFDWSDSVEGWVINHEIDGDSFGEQYGSSLSFSDDGNILAIGSARYDDIYSNATNVGRVRVWQYGDNSKEWEQMDDVIVGDDENDFFGSSVSLSSDGKILVIGASLTRYVTEVMDVSWGIDLSEYSGRVLIYTFDSGQGTWLPSKEIKSQVKGDHFGSSISLSGDGRRLAVGATLGASNEVQSGVIYIYGTENDLDWNLVGDALPGERVNDFFGFSVSLSKDGKILAAGGPFNDDNVIDSGHVRVSRYLEDNEGWQVIGEDIDGQRADDSFGFSLKLTGDGNRVIAGGAGVVRVLEYTSKSK